MKEIKMVDWIESRLREKQKRRWICDTLNKSGFTNDNVEPLGVQNINRYMHGAGTFHPPPAKEPVHEDHA
jgi:hypothetical protein